MEVFSTLNLLAVCRDSYHIRIQINLAKLRKKVLTVFLCSNGLRQLMYLTILSEVCLNTSSSSKQVIATSAIFGCADLTF